MNAHTGLLFAFVALVGWGFGDFFIQKTTRLMGLYKTLFLMIFAGIALAAAARLDHLHIHKRIFEKGVALAFAGAFLSALTNFYIGTYSKHMSPLFVIWATHTMLALLCGAYMLVRGEFGSLWGIVKKHPGPVIAQSIFDNAAWIGYAFATSIIPISLTVSISESYIALAALLGYFVGKEKLGWHQLVGAIIAFIGVFFLAQTI